VTGLDFDSLTMSRQFAIADTVNAGLRHSQIPLWEFAQRSFTSSELVLGPARSGASVL
jgi:hypothetical protein